MSEEVAVSTSTVIVAEKSVAPGTIPVTSPAQVVTVPITSGRFQTATSNVANTPKREAVVTKAGTTQPLRTTLQASINKTEAPKIGKPKSMKSGNTNHLDQAFFRCVLYAETSARKTTIAAHFDSPENTRIVLTRSEDQMRPLQGEGYLYEQCPDAAAVTYALKHPEQIWPDWAQRPNPTLIVDDLTKAVSILVESNAGSKDRRQAYTGALADLDSLIVPLTRRPYNLILISLAKVRENQISGEETVGPDLSPSIYNYITSEFAGVFYIQTKNFKILTDRDRFTVIGTDPATGKDKPFTREIFAKHKIPFSAVGKGILKKEEEADLRAIWNKIRSAHQVQLQVQEGARK